tara:strand:- start:698 stop:1540 length:843 start_codon:yes stop_codon:yes gene_type:complete
LKRNIVVSKSNNTKRNAKYRAKKGNKTKKDSSSSEENKELPVGAELLIAASVPAMLVGTLVAGIGLLSTESALAGSNGNGNIVATPVSTPTKTLELVAQVADEEVVSADFDLKQMLIDASKLAPATESSEAKEKVARDKKQKAADAKAAKAKKKADAKAAAAAKKLELAKKKVEARKQLPKPNHEKAKDRAQRAREVTQAKIDAEKEAKAKIRAAMQAKVEAKTKSQSSSIGESETEKDKIARVNAQLRKKPEMAKPKAEPEADKMPAAPAAPTTAAVEK